MFSPNAAPAGPRGPLGATALGPNPHLSLAGAANPYAALGEPLIKDTSVYVWLRARVFRKF